MTVQVLTSPSVCSCSTWGHRRKLRGDRGDRPTIRWGIIPPICRKCHCKL